MRRLCEFSCGSVFEIKVSGRLTSAVVRAAAKIRPDIAIDMFLPQLCQRVIDHASSTVQTVSCSVTVLT